MSNEQKSFVLKIAENNSGMESSGQVIVQCLESDLPAITDAVLLEWRSGGAWDESDQCYYSGSDASWTLDSTKEIPHDIADYLIENRIMNLL